MKQNCKTPNVEDTSRVPPTASDYLVWLLATTVPQFLPPSGFSPITDSLFCRHPTSRPGPEPEPNPPLSSAVFLGLHLPKFQLDPFPHPNNNLILFHTLVRQCCLLRPNLTAVSVSCQPGSTPIPLQRSSSPSRVPLSHSRGLDPVLSPLTPHSLLG